MLWLLTSRKLPLLFVEGFPFGRCDGDTVGFVTGGNRCWKFSLEKKMSTQFWLTVLGSKVALPRFFKTPCLSQQPQQFLRQVMFPLCLFNAHQSLSPLRANPDAGSAWFCRITPTSDPFLSAALTHLLLQSSSVSLGSALPAWDMPSILTVSLILSRVWSYAHPFQWLPFFVVNV